MNILIAFGSTEGHTRKISHHISRYLDTNGHSSSSYDCGSLDEKPDLSIFDGIIVAGSIHQEVHQQFLIDFVKNNLDVLRNKPSAFVSVSLAASIKDGMKEAEKYVAEFISETGWKPENIHMTGGAIRFLEYDFFKRFTVEHIVLKGNQMPDASSGNPEYTDWNAIDAFVDAFLKSAA